MQVCATNSERLLGGHCSCTHATISFSYCKLYSTLGVSLTHAILIRTACGSNVLCIVRAKKEAYLSEDFDFCAKVPQSNI